MESILGFEGELGIGDEFKSEEAVAIHLVLGLMHLEQPSARVSAREV